MYKKSESDISVYYTTVENRSRAAQLENDETTRRNDKTKRQNDRPMLLSSATAADLTAWEDAWHDFSCCQKLSCQDKQTRASTIRQCLDEDLRRFIREDTISVPADPDASDIIDAVRTFIRRQRNPLLDRISFYNRQQHRGELLTRFSPL